MDHRVCPICKPFENQIFQPNEDKPSIPLHFNCRCTFDVIFKEPDKKFEGSFEEIAEVVTISRKIKRQREIESTTMLKLIEVIEAIENE